MLRVRPLDGAKHGGVKELSGEEVSISPLSFEASAATGKEEL